MSDLVFAESIFGDATAPKGSPAWAAWWRSQLYGAYTNLDSYPKRFESIKALGVDYRAWMLLGDKDGKPFPDFKSLCEYPRPHGLGASYEKITCALELVHGKKGVALLAVAPDGRRNNRRGGKGLDETRHDGAIQDSRTEDRLRAILRAPEYVQDLYRQDLISQKVAAKLGPAEPGEKATPAKREAYQAAVKKAVEVVGVIQTFVQPQARVKAGEDKVAIRKQIDRHVKGQFGVGEDDKAARIVRQIAALSAGDFDALVRGLAQVGLVLVRETEP
jgi:hypothetical protein